MRAVIVMTIALLFFGAVSPQDAVAQEPPEVMISIGCGAQCPPLATTQHLEWDLTDPAGEDIASMRTVRDQIESRVKAYIENV